MQFDIQKLLQELLLTGMLICIPYVVKFLRQKSQELISKISNNKANQRASEIAEAVTTAVSAVMQTYVDSMKDKNMFTEEAQLEALCRAKNTVIAVLSPAVRDFIESTYEDVDAFLTAKIEEEVRHQKQGANLITEAVVVE